MQIISQNTITYLLIILQIFDKGIGGNLVGTPTVFPYCLHYFLLFQVFHQRDHPSNDRADFHASSVGTFCGKRFANSHFVSLPEKLKTVNSNSLSLMEAGDTTGQHLSASERQMQALTANVQELTQQSAADHKKIQELTK